MDIALLVNVVAFATVAIVGSAGNAMFLITLASSKTIRNVLGTAAILLGALTVNDLLAATVVIPLRVWNLFDGAEKPRYFTANSPLCTYSSRAFYALPQTSMWLLCALAISRTFAVYTPHFYRRTFRRVYVQILLALFAVCIGWAPAVIGLLANWFVVLPSPYSGVCEALPVSYTSEGDSNAFALYVQLESWKSAWIPLPLGLLLYALVYARLYWQKHAKVNVVSATVANAQLLPLEQRVATATIDNQINSSAREKLKSGQQVIRTASSVRTKETKLPKSGRDRTLIKLRLLFANHAVNCLVTLPTAISFATQMYATTWGMQVARLWTALGILYLWAIAVNPLVFAATSQDVRAEYKRMFTKCK